MRSKLIFTLVAITLLGGCATGFHRGVVAMKIDDSTAHVGLNRNEAKNGEHVELYGNKCSGPKEIRECQRVSKGHGTITEIINDNYVAVKFDSGVAFQEGDFIEIHKH